MIQPSSIFRWHYLLLILCVGMGYLLLSTPQNKHQETTRPSLTLAEVGDLGVLVVEDLDTYFGITVESCDVYDQVFPTNVITWDNGDRTYNFVGNIKCKTETGTLFIPATVVLTVEGEDGVLLDNGWQSTSPMTQRTTKPEENLCD